MPFASLGLSPALVHAAEKAGFVAPTPIQAGAIPSILQGADLLGAAQTGSGKTAAFALPLLQQLQLSATGGGSFSLPNGVTTPFQGPTDLSVPIQAPPSGTPWLWQGSCTSGHAQLSWKVFDGRSR